MGQRIEPLTETNWEDFASLCRAMGSNRSCWCLWWREDGIRGEGAARSRALQLVRTCTHPIGALAYEGTQPVGWVAVSPRSEYPRLNRARDTASVGPLEGVWAVPCFFVLPPFRGKGLSHQLLTAALAIARAHGADAVEGVPGDPATKERTPTASYTGTVALFAGASFREVARRTKSGRVLMRRQFGHPQGGDPDRVENL
ncbi:MAG: GNAT family N-acetyltransferase [Ferrimicrobium sp.]